MNWDEVCALIAQGAINITEGHGTIEVGSPVHKAMLAFCEYISAHPLQVAEDMIPRVLQRETLETRKLAIRRVGREIRHLRDGA